MTDLDGVSRLHARGLGHVLEAILKQLDYVGVLCFRLVCKPWLRAAEEIIARLQRVRIDRAWMEEQPTVSSLSCSKRRAVCTVSDLALDEASVAVALGSSGDVELWCRRTQTRSWSVTEAHLHGIYSVDMSSAVVVTGGDDAKVKVWSRTEGSLLLELDHHTYIVWHVELRPGQLVTASYDCTVCFFSLSSAFSPAGNNHHSSSVSVSVNLRRSVQGPWTWSNALCIDCANDDRSGNSLLATHDEETFAVFVWNLSSSHHDTPALTLLGHEGEVHCVRFCRAVGLAATGGDDRTVRLWDLETGEALRVLRGTEGKVWSVDMDDRRVVAGARYGEVRVWSLLAKEEKEDSAETTPTPPTERSLWLHGRSTSVGQVRLHRASLVSGNGIGVVVIADFWTTRQNACFCAKSNNNT